MNKIKLTNTLFIYLFFLTACSATNNVKHFTPQIVADSHVLVYVYRPFSTSNAMYSPDLYINDEFKHAIKNAGHRHFTLPPGHYNFALEAGNNASTLSRLSLNLRAGDTYFLRVDTSLKIKSALTYEPYIRSFSLTEVEQQLALKEIVECCVTNNIESKVEAEAKAVNKQTEEGFSVDRTQNPFSY